MPRTRKIDIIIWYMNHYTTGVTYHTDACLRIDGEDYYTDTCIEQDDIGKEVKIFTIDGVKAKDSRMDGDYIIKVPKDGEFELYKVITKDGVSVEYIIHEANYTWDFNKYNNIIDETDPAWDLLGYPKED